MRCALAARQALNLFARHTAHITTHIGARCDGPIHPAAEGPVCLPDPSALLSLGGALYAVIATPAVCFLPQDAFYFGIASVMKDVMAQFGITATQAAVASMVGQSFRLVSPVIPALYMLCGECKLNFTDFMKEYAKRYGLILLVVYMVVYGIVGALPF